MSKPFLRDAQKRRLYGAEDLVFGHLPPSLPPSKGVEPAQRFVDRIMASRWMRTRYPAAAYPLKVVGRNGNNATNTRIMLDLSRRRQRWVVLHELAHTIEWRCNMFSPVQPHGRQFANIYLALVRQWLGESEYVELKETFRVNRVKFHLPRKGRTKRAGNPAALAAYRARQLAAKV